MGETPRLTGDAASGRLAVGGAWSLGGGDPFLAPAVPAGAWREAVLDGSALTALDTSGAYALLQRLKAAGIDPGALRYEGFDARQLGVLRLVAERWPQEGAPALRPAPGLLHRLGYGAEQTRIHLLGLLAFLGRFAVEAARLLAHPRRFRVREWVVQLQAVFVDAIPLVVAMVFLLGVVFAYLLGFQARQYGANIFVVDGVTLAVCRELSPVIVAILVAGRSGAAMTAQLGTMKVTEEIDAIAVQGLSPFDVLVTPRILALLLALPLLVFVGDVAGLLGGMFTVRGQLDIGYTLFFDRLSSVLTTDTFLVGIVKAPVFALFIGLIACRMGLVVARDARAVGFATTSTVVQSIVSVILLDALFAILQVRLGI